MYGQYHGCVKCDTALPRLQRKKDSTFFGLQMWRFQKVYIFKASETRKVGDARYICVSLAIHTHNMHCKDTTHKGCQLFYLIKA